MESCQTHGRGKTPIAKRRETARQNPGAACKTSANAPPCSLILQSPFCRLYWRLLSNRSILPNLRELRMRRLLILRRFYLAWRLYIGLSYSWRIALHKAAYHQEL